jgi:hypothetical protein
MIQARPEQPPRGSFGKATRAREDVLADGGDDPGPLAEAVEREQLEQERVDRLLLYPDGVRAGGTDLAGKPRQALAPRPCWHVPHLDRQPRPRLRIGLPVRDVDARQVGL